ncbi:MAG: sel1 repeat family protein, partial [bacterium]|nr:sel1 repeat family protein [bacterium]
MNTNTQYEHLIDRAERGDSDAQLELGNVYLNEKQSPENTCKAIQWFYCAAEMEHPDAQYMLGLLKLKGKGFRKNRETAVSWFHKAAAQGHEMAFTRLLEAAESGFAPAQAKIGILFLHGEGVPQNDEKAYDWLDKAFQQGHYEAEYYLGLSFLERGDNADGISALYRSAQKGFPDSMVELFLFHLQGKNVEMDLDKALYWINSAAMQGFAPGFFYLGLMYREGTGVTANIDKAVSYLTQAADSGHGLAATNLGYMYLKGEKVPTDMEDACYWIFRAAENGEKASLEMMESIAESSNAEFKLDVGRRFYFGDGPEQNFKKAIHWLKQAADSGSADANRILGTLKREPDIFDHLENTDGGMDKISDPRIQMKISIMDKLNFIRPKAPGEDIEFRYLKGEAEKGCAKSQF